MYPSFYNYKVVLHISTGEAALAQSGTSQPPPYPQGEQPSPAPYPAPGQPSQPAHVAGPPGPGYNPQQAAAYPPPPPGTY